MKLLGAIFLAAAVVLTASDGFAAQSNPMSQGYNARSMTKNNMGRQRTRQPPANRAQSRQNNAQ